MEHGRNTEMSKSKSTHKSKGDYGIAAADEPQLLNELATTGVTAGLLINFGSIKVEL